MESKTTTTVGDGLRNGLELVKSFSDKHIDLLRPSARYNSSVKDSEKGSKYMLIKDDTELGTYERRLPCFGCGIGWFSFLLGFAFPVMWFYATFLYFGNYRKDPRERAGLAASAIAAMGSTVILLLVIIVIILL